MFVRVSFLDRCLYGWAFVFIFSALCTTPKVWTARPQAYRVKHLKCLDRVFGLRAAKMFVRVGLLPFFGHFSRFFSRKKKASRPQPPARFDPRGFFSKKAYPYKHPKPDVCAARLFWATKWRGTNIRRRETARGSSAKGHGNGPEMVVSPLGCLGRAGRADPKRLTRTNIRPKSTRTNIRGARSEQKRGGIT